MNGKSKVVALLLSVTLAIVLGGAVQRCGTAAGASIGYATNVSYGGSGSAWTANLNADLSFTITRKASVSATTTDLTVTGTFTRLTSGILQLTVSSSSDTTNGPTAGDKAYALDVPGYVLMLKPMSSNGGEIIPMVAIGSCPTATFTGNWVMMQDSSTTTDYSTSSLAGSFTYTAGTSAGSVGADRYRGDGTVDTGSVQSLGTVTCSGGVGSFTDTGNGVPEMYFTTSGGAIVKTRPSLTQSQGIVMMPASTISISDFEGTYVGLAFDEGDTGSQSNGSTQPVSVTLNSSGTGTGAVITDVTTNTLSTTQTATLAVSQMSPVVNGVLKMTLTPTAGAAQNTICSAAANVAGTTQEVIFCAGDSPSDGTHHSLRSYLLVTKR